MLFTLLGITISVMGGDASPGTTKKRRLWGADVRIESERKKQTLVQALDAGTMDEVWG